MATMVPASEPVIKPAGQDWLQVRSNRLRWSGSQEKIREAINTLVLGSKNESHLFPWKRDQSDHKDEYGDQNRDG